MTVPAPRTTPPTKATRRSTTWSWRAAPEFVAFGSWTVSLPWQPEPSKIRSVATSALGELGGGAVGVGEAEAGALAPVEVRVAGHPVGVERHPDPGAGRQGQPAVRRRCHPAGDHVVGQHRQVALAGVEEVAGARDDVRGRVRGYPQLAEAVLHH